MALQVENLHTRVGGTEILHGVTLRAEKGEVVAVMGPNGSGKSTLLYTIMGRPGYTPTKGRISLDGEDLTALPPEERSLKGVMLAFQDPVPVPGVKLSMLLTAAWNKRRGAKELTRPDPRLLAAVRRNARDLGLREELLHRDVNVGFSGGEKKRSEMLQLLTLRPRYALLDEPDSGLDVDGVKTIAAAAARLAEEGAGIVIVTHYARILRFLEPSRVYVLVDGRVVDEGGPSLAHRIDREGYSRYLSSPAS